MSEYYIISEKLSISPLMMLDDIFDKIRQKEDKTRQKTGQNKAKYVFDDIFSLKKVSGDIHVFPPLISQMVPHKGGYSIRP